MIIEIKINASKDKYGSPLASTELSIDSDDIDAEAISNLASDMALSAIARAKAKLKKEATVAPLPVAVREAMAEAVQPR